MPTTNPVPSTDPSDLLFNAQKLDEVVNGTANSFTDRLGVARRTIAGIDAAADLVLSGLGYAPPVAYAAGIALTLTTQTVEYAGEVYAPKGSVLPFTTSGAFETEKFRMIQGVASADLPALVGEDLQDYAALRAYTGRAKRICITGLLVTAKPAGIFGTFQHDQTDTTSSDNGGTIIVGTDGRRWKREFDGDVDVKWFGAIGDGVTDDSIPVKNALAYCVAKSYTATFGTFPAAPEINGADLFFPPGKYRVTQNLTDLTSAGLARGRIQGIKLSGVPMKSIIFCDLGDNVYLFDNFSGTPISSYLRMHFENLAFVGANSTGTSSSLMRAWSNGQSDKHHLFTNCVFQNLRTVIRTEGSANADFFTFHRCMFYSIWNYVMHLNNKESVVHRFTDCDITGATDALIYTGTTGGNVTWKGGSIQIGYEAARGGKDSMQYLYKAGSPSHGNNRFLFFDVRIELSSKYSGLVLVDNPDATSITTFEECNFSGTVDAAIPRQVVDITYRQKVRFVRCQLPVTKQIAGSENLDKTLQYVLRSPASEQYATMRPTIEFIESEIPFLDSANFIFPNDARGGRVVARGCFQQVVNYSVPGNPTVAIDYNWPAGFGGAGINSAEAHTHKVALYREGTYWPRDITGDAGNEKVVILPMNATIMNIVVFKPAHSVSTFPYQLKVGNGDKTVIYGTSVNSNYGIEHRIQLTNLNIRTSDLNSRTVRLWADPPGSPNVCDIGFAYIEYC